MRCDFCTHDRDRTTKSMEGETGKGNGSFNRPIAERVEPATEDAVGRPVLAWASARRSYL